MATNAMINKNRVSVTRSGGVFPLQRERLENQPRCGTKTTYSVAAMTNSEAEKILLLCLHQAGLQASMVGQAVYPQEAIKVC